MLDKNGPFKSGAQGKTNASGWVPSSGNRTAQAFSQPGKGMPHMVASTVRLTSSHITGPLTVTKQTKSQMLLSKHQQRVEDNTDDTWYSIFPVENEELVYGSWEDEVIWDSENMARIPKPKILTLDPNDENIVLGIPDDVDPAKQRSDSATPAKVKIPHPHVKKSKILLGKAGVINVMEEDAPAPPPKSPDRDPFNVSNDRLGTLQYNIDCKMHLKFSVPPTGRRALTLRRKNTIILLAKKYFYGNPTY